MTQTHQLPPFPTIPHPGPPPVYPAHAPASRHGGYQGENVAFSTAVRTKELDDITKPHIALPEDPIGFELSPGTQEDLGQVQPGRKSVDLFDRMMAEADEYAKSRALHVRQVLKKRNRDKGMKWTPAEKTKLRGRIESGVHRVKAQQFVIALKALTRFLIDKRGDTNVVSPTEMQPSRQTTERLDCTTAANKVSITALAGNPC